MKKTEAIPKSKVSITLDADVTEAVRNLAKEKGLSFSTYVNIVLKKKAVKKGML